MKYLHIPASEIVNCRTYGGHGEQMAVFASTTKVQGEALTKIIDTPRMPMQDWEAVSYTHLDVYKRQGLPFL